MSQSICTALQLVACSSKGSAELLGRSTRLPLFIIQIVVNIFSLPLTRLLFIAFILCWSSAAHLSPKILSEDLSALASHPQWLALLHFVNGESDIKTSEFFFAEDGAVSAEAELVATIAAFNTPRNKDVRHPQCLFPARKIWLSLQLGSGQFKAVKCSEWQRWAELDTLESISMIYATGHMKSPVSYFGHNFLKFNNGNSVGTSRLLDPTINFGADVPDTDGGLKYFIKGIFGGYKAGFEMQLFYRHMAKYGEAELRDVWEYVLNLDAEEVELVAAHSFELQRQKLDYYFFRENCAHQIAKLLGVVVDRRLVPRHSLWTMPYNVIDRLSVPLNVPDQIDKVLIDDIIYHPSRRTRFHQTYFKMSTELKAIFKRQIASFNIAGDATFIDDYQALGSDGKITLIEGLLDYYEYQVITDDSDSESAEIKRRLLLERFTLPSQPKEIHAHDASPPHLAQKPSRVALAVVEDKNLGYYTEVQLRPAYFDFLSLDAGRKADAHFTVLDTRFGIAGGELKLLALDFLNITNLNPSITGLSDDRGWSWHFRFGLDESDPECFGCIALNFDWTAGHAVKFGEGFTGFALAGLHLEEKSKYQSNAIRADVGVTGSLGDSARFYAALEHQQSLTTTKNNTALDVDIRFGKSTVWDVRLGYKYKHASRLKLSVAYHW